MKNIRKIGIFCIIAAMLTTLYCVLPYPRKVWALKYYLKTYPSRAYSLKRCEVSGQDAEGTVTLTFNCHIVRTDEILADALALKRDLEQYLNAHAALYENTGIVLKYETDADDLYMKISTYGDSDVGTISLEDGVFHGRIGNLAPFRETSAFVSLDFAGIPMPNDLTALDGQTELKYLTVKGSDISEEMRQHLQEQHPDCEITIRN